MKIVLDTSSISAFIRSDLLDLLIKICSSAELVITNQVHYELKLSQIDKLRRFQSTKISTVFANSTLVEKYSIHIGEASVISFAKENSALAVIDDKKAREVAKLEKISFVGTAFLLKLGLEKNVIKKSEIKSIIEKISNEGKLYLSEEIRNWITEG